MLFEAGRWDELTNDADVLVTSELYYPSSLGRSYKALVHLWRGRYQEAESMDVLTHAKKMAEPQVLGPALVVAALIEFRRGRKDSAISLLEQFEEVTRTTPWLRALQVLDGVRVCLAVGALDLAQSLLGGFGSQSQRDRVTRLAAHALYAESSGAFEEALVGFQEAANQWGKFGYPLEEALALRGAARSLARLGRDEESSLRFLAARSLLESLQIDHHDLSDAEFSEL
jgi:tetratricopeptide (TPR) repeat protein